jgi:hypothetical protein
VTRTCTVCSHPERHEIDRALVKASTPYRDIALRYGLGSHMAVMRHKADHLLPAIVEAWQAERQQNGLDLAEEVRGWMETIGKMLRACDEWLTDPDDPARYDLSPRASELMVHYETTVAGPGGRPIVVRRKARLQALLGALSRVRDGLTVTAVESKSADPRKLILDTTKTLESHMRLVAEIAGKIATQGSTTFLISPEWVALRGRMLVALAEYPQARLALAAALEEDTGAVAA